MTLLLAALFPFFDRSTPSEAESPKIDLTIAFDISGNVRIDNAQRTVAAIQAIPSMCSLHPEGLQLAVVTFDISTTYVNFNMTYDEEVERRLAAGKTSKGEP